MNIVKISGDCETCGRWDSDLVDGMCSICREKYKLGTPSVKKTRKFIHESVAQH